MSLEKHFDSVFVASLALREKQIQQNYRPIIGVHKWFARRPGTVFRNLLLAEFNSSEPLTTSYWHSHSLKGVIADPFMGGGTPIIEANRLGFSVVGADTNPMAWWIVRQSLTALDFALFSDTANEVALDVEQQIGELYETECPKCGKTAKVKYFLWVKTQKCPSCGNMNDLFPGYLLAEAVRHPKNVVACRECGALNEYEETPTAANPARCSECRHTVSVEGSAHRQKVSCSKCGLEYHYPAPSADSPPVHRMWAIEYHCSVCKPNHVGRFFKRPDAADAARFVKAEHLRHKDRGIPIPTDNIPAGDETDRLHRWGYRYYREMFNDRQLLGLGVLLQRIQEVREPETRYALLTVFSDFLRYQNMLCRYDTYALKCQDIFSVHGFPVGLIQCEDNLLGIPRIGAGSFRHYVEKYLRAKQYCVEPFETLENGARARKQVSIPGETILAEITDTFPSSTGRKALLLSGSAGKMPLSPNSLDGVFTDPPYFDNVQYAELMDFCYVWLRLALGREFKEFQASTTRSTEELTGNSTLGRGLEHFTSGLSAIFRHYAQALKIGKPFVFTYHHNDPSAYVPIIVAVLDADMYCSVSLPAVAEMNASLHILGTGSSVLDSVFVCRVGSLAPSGQDIKASLQGDIEAMISAGVRVSAGDIRCLASGHVAQTAINRLHQRWNPDLDLAERMKCARQMLEEIADEAGVCSLPIAKMKLAARAIPTEVKHATAV